MVNLTRGQYTRPVPPELGLGRGKLDLITDDERRSLVIERCGTPKTVLLSIR